MHVKSLYPDPPPVPDVNVHFIFFKRPDQVSWPDYPIHINPETDERVMRSEFISRIEALSTGLATPISQGGLGVDSNEIIAIMGENSSEYITLLHACIRVAVTCVPIPSYSTPFELNHVLSLSGATRLFVDEKFLDEVLLVAQKFGIGHDKIHILKFGTKVTKMKSFWSIINDVRTKNIKIVDIRKATKDKLAYLIFSSGTGGLPKAVMISHGNLVFSIAQGYVFGRAPANDTPPSILIGLGFLPLHHTYGLYAYAFRPCLIQTTLVILSQWDVRLALASIPKYQITSLGLVPSLVHQIVNFPGIENVDFSSISTVSSGAAHLPQGLKLKLQTLIPRKAQFIEGYGMSESTFVAIVQPPSGHKVQAAFGSTGVLAPGMEARILREDGTDANINEPGELWLRGASVTVGYWKNDKVNRASFKDGWLRTGDTFRVDGNGNFWFGDRIKDILKVSGEQVSPVEIENCLLAQPDRLITDAAVAGVSGGRTSDEKIPRAWVVLSIAGKKLGKDLVVKTLNAWHKDSLSRYKHLRGGIEVIDEIPKSPTGKTLRKILQDRYESEVTKRAKAQL